MNKELICRLIGKYSWQGQVILCVEEMAELQKELIKNLRGKNNETCIAEEIADVEIMLEQLRYIFGDIDSKIKEYKEIKIERIKKILED